MASLSRHYQSSYHSQCSSAAHNGRTAAPGRKRSQLCKRPAVYPAFAQQATRGIPCLRHSMTDAISNSIPHRSSRGLPRSAHGGAPLATCGKRATAGRNNENRKKAQNQMKTSPSALKLRKPLTAGTWNVRTLWKTGAARLLVEQLSRARINLMGLPRSPLARLW